MRDPQNAQDRVNMFIRSARKLRKSWGISLYLKRYDHAADRVLLARCVLDPTANPYKNRHWQRLAMHYELIDKCARWTEETQTWATLIMGCE
jgi:hypothetical protein